MIHPLGSLTIPLCSATKLNTEHGVYVKPNLLCAGEVSATGAYQVRRWRRKRRRSVPTLCLGQKWKFNQNPLCQGFLAFTSHPSVYLSATHNIITQIPGLIILYCKRANHNCNVYGLVSFLAVNTELYYSTYLYKFACISLSSIAFKIHNHYYNVGVDKMIHASSYVHLTRL